MRERVQPHVGYRSVDAFWAGGAYYDAKRQIICLELPDDRWIGIKTQNAKDGAPLLKGIRRLYGDRLRVADQ